MAASLASGDAPPAAPPLPPAPEPQEDQPTQPRPHQEEIAARPTTPAAVESAAPGAVINGMGTTSSSAAKQHYLPDQASQLRHSPLPPEEAPAVKLLPADEDDVISAIPKPMNPEQPEASRDWAKEAIAAISEADEMTRGTHPGFLGKSTNGPPVVVKEAPPTLPPVSTESARAAYVNRDVTPPARDLHSPSGNESAEKASGGGDILDDIISGHSPAPAADESAADDAAVAAAVTDLDKANSELAELLAIETAAAKKADDAAVTDPDEVNHDIVQSPPKDTAAAPKTADAASGGGGDAAVVDLVVVAMGEGAEPDEVLIPENVPVAAADNGSRGLRPNGQEDDGGVTLVETVVTQATLEQQDSSKDGADFTLVETTIVHVPAEGSDGGSSNDEVTISNVTAVIVEPPSADEDCRQLIGNVSPGGADSNSESPTSADDVMPVGSTTLARDPAAAAAAGIIAVEVATVVVPLDDCVSGALEGREGDAAAGNDADDDSSGIVDAAGSHSNDKNGIQSGETAAVARSLVMAFLHQVVLFLKLLLSFFIPSANTSSPVGDRRQTSKKQR